MLQICGVLNHVSCLTTDASAQGKLRRDKNFSIRIQRIASSIKGKVSGCGKVVKYLEARLKFPAGNWGGGPETLPFRCVSSLFCDTSELLLQDFYAVHRLYLELGENQLFLCKIIETEVFGKRWRAFEEQNLPPGVFF